MYQGNLIEYAQVEWYDNIPTPCQSPDLRRLWRTQSWLRKPENHPEGMSPPINPAPGRPFRKQVPLRKGYLRRRLSRKVEAVTDKHKVACHLFD